jgi:hypothetical protein
MDLLFEFFDSLAIINFFAAHVVPLDHIDDLFELPYGFFLRLQKFDVVQLH